MTPVAASPPPPDEAADGGAFTALQARLEPLFRVIQADPRAPRTVVVVPGISMDQEVLARIDGLQHYEERQLTMLMLLRLPNTRVVFVTSTPIDPVVIDYYLSLLPGIPHPHALRRLTMLSACDGSGVSLSRKILERPRLIERIRAAVGDPSVAHLSCFNSSDLERQLALRLGIPLYACDPRLAPLGGKSGSREVFREAGIALPAGSENLRDAGDVVQALAALRHQQPILDRAVVKLNDGASGEGNAVFPFEGAPGDATLAAWIAAELPRRLAYEAPDEHWEHYSAKFAEMRGIVEAWIPGAGKRSPSVQLRVTPTGLLETISTHDQVLGGLTGQKFLGSTFPADAGYRLALHEDGRRVGEVLRRHGVLGRFGVDFVVVPQADGTWRRYAIEINLRKGGTTHTFQTLQYLTDGRYGEADGVFRVPTGQVRVYYATDNLQNPLYRRLTPQDLIDVAVEHDLHFDHTLVEGVTFNLIGALSEFGKLGVVSIAGSAEAAMRNYQRTVRTLDQVSARG
jgi:hypothetical protein